MATLNKLLEEFIDYDELSDEQMYYLHGDCHNWAIQNYKSGDIICALVEFDEDIERDALLHAFIKRGNEYIDVRGTTNDFEDILDDFDYGDYEEYNFNSVSEFNTFLEEIGVI